MSPRLLRAGKVAPTLAATLALFGASGCVPAQQDAATAAALAKLQAEVSAIRQAQDKASPPGRFQVVNGTPSMTRNIMLLDTQTGQTWIFCSDPKIGGGWCDMPTGFTQSGKVVQ